VNSERHTSILIQFGKHLKKLREAKGLSQEALANDAELSISQISRIERGVITSSLSQLISISKSLGIPLKTLFDFLK
jgi:transcriptional regulator with XRE-family HTH domain